MQLWSSLRKHCVASLLLVVPLGAQGVREPLPAGVAVDASGHNGRSAFNLSADGQWIAHTWSRPEKLRNDSRYHSASGVAFAEGTDRMQAAISNTFTGEMIRLGGDRGSSWGPVWSPDGRRVAYYADDDGEAGIWIFELATRRSRRIAGVVARPFFGFEFVRWSADGKRLLAKVLPEGMTIAQANALVPSQEVGRRFPPPTRGGARVLVYENAARRPGDSATAAPRPQATGFAGRSLGDLATIEVETGRVTRVARRGNPMWWSWSPAGQQLAFTELTGFVPNSQQPAYQIGVYDMTSGTTRVVARDVALSYGIEISWSPDGKRLAWIHTAERVRGEMVMYDLVGNQLRMLTSTDGPNLKLPEGEQAPLWDARGERLYTIDSQGRLWRMSADGTPPVMAADIPGRLIRTPVASAQRLLWTTDDSNTAWMVTRERSGDRAGIFWVDLTTGQATAVYEERKALNGIFSVDAASSTGDIAFVARDQQHLADIWVLNTRSGASRQVTQLNAGIQRYELGAARLISYRGTDGQPLRASLLLPPGYQDGQKLPMVVWVYGGDLGSRFVNSFGFWGDLPTFNMHVLATRGYAVLFPDTPIGPGTPMRDLYHTVMPAVNAAVDQGFADPDRLAISGQSYGSYSTLALVTQTKRFKAAIISAAVLHPDLFAAYLEMLPDGTASGIGYYEQGQGNMLGDIWKERQRYFDNSPLFAFDQIDTPLLIGQGAKDGTLVASDAIFVALRRLGKAVEYRLYEDEGHVITGRANAMDFWERRIAFLAEHLGPKRESRGSP